MKSLGIDIGSSSVKISVMDIASGKSVVSATCPSTEMPISSVEKGFAEQNPEMWFRYIKEGIKQVQTVVDMVDIKAIGITYQMHGLVCIDKSGALVRDSIIWCDSRAVEIGQEAYDEIGEEKCKTHLLTSPGNFTASKLAWVKRNEPELYSRIDKFFLPGDYIAYLLSGDIATTSSGLSEQILWDFKEDGRADFVADYYGIDLDKIPADKPSIGIQCRTNKETEVLLGIKEGTPISYRSGDQPNNAFSLNVLDAGEIAATGGTSGVVYGVTDIPKADVSSRVNPFLHLNHNAEKASYGVLLCINGTGILNAWTKRNFAENMSYAEINAECEKIDVGSACCVATRTTSGWRRTAS